jgi:hypothetical protein
MGHSFVLRRVLIQRLRQLENAPKSASAHSRPSALPLGPTSTRTLSFVQTVLGIHYEPMGLVPSAHQERSRPTRQSALQKDRTLLGDMKDDSATEKENKRSSKRQRPAKGSALAAAGAHPSSAGDAPSHGAATSAGGIGMNGPGGAEEGSIPLVAKSGTRIRLKPIAHPKVQADDEMSNADLSMNDNGYEDSLVGVKAGAKRARSPASSTQGPQKPTKKRNTASTAARNKINIPIIPRGPEGKPLLPMQVGMFTLRDLGRIISPDDLATPKSLYPIGYHCER